MLLTLAAASFLVASLPQSGPSGGLVAHVTDNASHGAVGDAMLSLDEAIRLANGTLTVAQLSPAEAANVTGLGSFVDEIEMDPMVTPMITLEGSLTPITGQSGSFVHVHSMVIGHGHTATRVVVDGGAFGSVFTLRTHRCEVAGVHITSGQVAFEVETTQGGIIEAFMARIEDCDMHGQTTAAVVLNASGNARSSVMLHHCEFHNLQRAILVDDHGAGGFAMLHAMDCHFDQVVTGCDAVVSSSGGAMSMAMFDRSEFKQGQNFLRVQRASTGNQQFMVRLLHCDISTTGDTVDVQGNALGMTMIHHHHSTLAAGIGQKALVVGPKTALFDVHGSEMEFLGDVLVRCNLFTQRVWQQNNVYRNGVVTFDCDGSLPNVAQNHYENCQIVVPSTARSALRLRSCELVNSSVAGQSLFAPVAMQDCWRSGASMSGFVSETQAAGGRFLSQASVSPTHVDLGGTFDLSSDAPQGVWNFWVMSVGVEQPNTTEEPFRYYGETLGAETIWLTTGQTNVTMTMPNDPAFLSWEFYFASATWSQLPYGPEVTLPRGGRMQPIE